MSGNKENRSGGLNTGYLTKMGFHNLISNRSMTLSSVSVLTACLLLIGISLSVLFNIRTLVNDVEKQNVIVVFVEDNAGQEATQKVGTDISSIENVTKVEFVPKEEAYADQLASFGIDESIFDGMIQNPLPDSYRVTVSNLETFSETLELIKQVDNVFRVRESQELVSHISTLQKSVSVICAVVVAVLVVVSLFIITNTIRITMVSRKIDIQVMKSVGATNVFIRWPFMVEGVVIGLISGGVSLLLIYLMERLEGDAFNRILSMLGSSTVSIFEHWQLLLVTYLVAGVLMGAVGSIVSIAKYLRKEGSEANETM